MFEETKIVLADLDSNTRLMNFTNKIASEMEMIAQGGYNFVYRGHLEEDKQKERPVCLRTLTIRARDDPQADKVRSG